jgi:S-adenosyl-L-methionine hydrolase (adenosine-forming)
MVMIALLTDFGLKDGYVGTMKGVIKSINPGEDIIDLSHEIKPQNVQEAGFILWQSYQYFPENTIFLCVVDPGVGSNRKILFIKTEKYFFLAPDNGLLDYVISRENEIAGYHIDMQKFKNEELSNTFHGRDIFAPLAANFSRNHNLKYFGKKISVEKKDLFIDINTDKRKYKGKIIHIDIFGNAISNMLLQGIISANVRILNRKIDGISKSYFDSKDMELIALKNSSNLLEIAVKNGNAANLYKIKTGTDITLELK